MTNPIYFLCLFDNEVNFIPVNNYVITEKIKKLMKNNDLILLLLNNNKKMWLNSLFLLDYLCDEKIQVYFYEEKKSFKEYLKLKIRKYINNPVLRILPIIFKKLENN